MVASTGRDCAGTEYSSEKYDLRKTNIAQEMIQKKGQAGYIAPLQPDTLASVKTWGISRGACRVGLTPLQSYILFTVPPKNSYILTSYAIKSHDEREK